MNKQEIYNLIEEHYRAYANILVKRLSNKMGSRYEAEDVVQETYVRACQYWQSYDKELKFNSWINGILGNCIKAKMNDIRHHGMVDDIIIDAEVQPPSLNFKIIEELIGLLMDGVENYGYCLERNYMYKILVCGGRNYNNYDHVSNTLNMIVCKHIIYDVIIIQGGAEGADFLAKQYAIVNCIKLKEYPANWNLYGRSAGFIRNEQMLLECPNLVVAF